MRRKPLYLSLPLVSSVMASEGCGGFGQTCNFCLIGTNLTCLGAGDSFYPASQRRQG